MSKLSVALVQFTATDDPAENTATLEKLVNQAADGGAHFVLTPEVSNIISGSRQHQERVLARQTDDQTLKSLSALAAARQIWLLIGSLALKSGAADGRFLNRSFLISPKGKVVVYYDKIHMFDVTLGSGENYTESAQFQPGNRAVLADTDIGKIGLTICYDLRFAALHRALAKAGAEIITVPAAFTVPTGKAHWHTLLKARAIETGCFILAPAQVGQHTKNRITYGHSLVVSPWGEVLADGGKAEGVTFAQLDLNLAAEARRKIPALTHDREFTGPDEHNLKQ
ncbi:MAG: carbon-nitrogen hydrolase family protein [Rhodobacteraceae bacterium]|nr:carbon-nitrogen hydrolase family protein [Paracoccaceae bacterium]